MKLSCEKEFITCGQLDCTFHQLQQYNYNIVFAEKWKKQTSLTNMIDTCQKMTGQITGMSKNEGKKKRLFLTIPPACRIDGLYDLLM